MDNKKINIHMDETSKELIIREGKAANIYDPKAVGIKGTIDAVTRYLTNRINKNEDESNFVNDHWQKQCHILADTTEGTVVLVVGEHEHFQDTIKAVLTVHPDIENFSINSGDYVSPDDMANFLKMRKHLFKSQADFADIFVALKSFEAKVNQDIKAASDDRGNFDHVRKQAVEHNVPKVFNLNVPLFKGQSKISFPVEFLVDRSLNVALSSTDLIQMLDEKGTELVEKELVEIQTIAPDVVIIYV